MSSEVIIHVAFAGPADARFDRDYYVRRHLPIVTEHWSKYGLLGIAAFFPAVAAEGTLSICECRFRDEAAAAAAFGSPEAPTVMADLPHFTDLVPTRTRAVAL